MIAGEVAAAAKTAAPVVATVSRGIFASVLAVLGTGFKLLGGFLRMIPGITAVMPLLYGASLLTLLGGGAWWHHERIVAHDQKRDAQWVASLNGASERVEIAAAKTWRAARAADARRIADLEGDNEQLKHDRIDPKDLPPACSACRLPAAGGVQSHPGDHRKPAAAGAGAAGAARKAKPSGSGLSGLFGN